MIFLKGGARQRMNSKPIAVFDSGLGGISVLRRLIQVLPEENFLYFGKPHTRRNEPHDYGTGKAEIGNSAPFMVIFVQLSKRYCGERQSVVFLHQ